MPHVDMPDTRKDWTDLVTWTLTAEEEAALWLEAFPDRRPMVYRHVTDLPPLPRPTS